MENTEVKAMSRRCRWQKKSDRAVACSLANSFGKTNAIQRPLRIKLANTLLCSTHRQYLRAYHSFVFINPPFPPSLNVPSLLCSKLTRQNSSLQIPEAPKNILFVIIKSNAENYRCLIALQLSLNWRATKG